MRTSSNRILTTHVGSLPRPDDLIEANRKREAGDAIDEADFQENLRAAVADVVQHQRASASTFRAMASSASPWAIASTSAHG